MKFGYNFGGKCDKQKGNIVDSWMTGDMECDAVSKEYECGGFIIIIIWMKLGHETMIVFGIVQVVSKIRLIE